MTLVYAAGLLVMLLLILLFGRYAAMSISSGVDALTEDDEPASEAGPATTVIERRAATEDAAFAARASVYNALGLAQRHALEEAQRSE